MKLLFQKKRTFPQIATSLIALVVLFLSCIPYFSKLDNLPIQLWDESRVSMNALCMYYNGDWGMTYFFDEPDMWNTKPPLLVWLQVVFMKLLGPCELAVRLPSALAAVGTGILLFWAGRKIYGNNLSGMIVAFVLSTSPLFVNIHGMRTGDYESLLTFLLSSFIICSFFCGQAYRQGLFKQAHRYLYIASMVLSLAVLTKGVQALIVVPAVFSFVIFYGGPRRILKDKHLYFAFLLFILIVGAWYVGREIKSAGYLQAVWENELGGRYFDSDSPVNHRPGHFYLTYLWEAYPWGTAVFGGCLLYTILGERKKSRVFALYLALCIAFYLSILSMSYTKIWWYMLPIIPLMAVIIGGISVPVIHHLNKLYRPAIIAPISLLLVVFFFAIPFAGIMKNIQKNEFGLYYEPQEDFGNYLRRLTKIEDEKEIRTNPLILVYGEGHYQRAHLNFYILQLQKRGIEVEYKQREELESGDFVCVAEQWVQDYVDARYQYEEVGREGKNMKLLRILGHHE
ncbi:4-amino-4-deoxy-L-arabinose transferase [Porphyromonas gulae]|nr:4-amino-4-deoxy-L-arabinose transferase [Porphyromonas gulae]KGN80130.1 4-amino-4-deoxy-L-arabinose transferase [Porphyromonas gulae]